jgi:hypothetical protein
MSCIVLTHLGPSVPTYMEYCCHQIRLWNPHSLPVYLILEGEHHMNKPFFLSLQEKYDITIVYTESLKPTEDHLKFNEFFKDQKELLKFRNGYWKFVKERFFLIEELMRARELKHVISMEYDILVYVPIREALLHKFQVSHQTIRVVKDNQERAHPGFMYIPNPDVMAHFNSFVLQGLPEKKDDMATLLMYGTKYPTLLNYLPCITEKRNMTHATRNSRVGKHKCENPWFLSQDSEHFQVIFDSAVIGQAVGGIDPRNTNGKKVSPYLNESALYTILEAPLGWGQEPETKKWFPVWDNRRVLTIHMHCKALKSFLSDRVDMPDDDYDVDEVMKTL